MAESKIEGYRKRDETYEPLAPKETKKEMKSSSPEEGSSMSQFRKSIDDHISDINKGRSNGIPDNYKKKDK
jgi:hypothetical protein